MATAQVTVNNAWELHDQLVTFLTSDPTLVANGEAWSLAADDQTGVETVAYGTNRNYGYGYRILDTGGDTRYYGTYDVTFSFHLAQSISGIRVYIDRPYNFGQALYLWNLEYSTDGGATWTLAASHNTTVTTPAGSYYDITFTAVSATHWRFTISPGNSTLSQEAGYIRLLDSAGAPLSMPRGVSRRTHLVAPVTAATPQPPAILLDSLGVSGAQDNWTRAIAYVCDPTNPTNTALWGSNVTDWQYVSLAGNLAQPAYLYANGRRFISVVNTGTSHESLYVGLLKPVTSTNRYKYPMLVAGNADQYISYTSTDDMKHYGCFLPMYSVSTRRKVVLPDGTAGRFSTHQLNSNSDPYYTEGPVSGVPAVFVHPHFSSVNFATYPRSESAESLDTKNPLKTLSGAYVLMQMSLFVKSNLVGNSWRTNTGAATPYIGPLGDLDGVYAVHAEVPVGTVLTVGANSYRVIGSAHKTAGMFKAAILEA